VQYAIRRDMMFEAAYVGSRGLNFDPRLGDQPSAVSQPAKPLINAVTGQSITTNTPAATNVALRAPFQVSRWEVFLQIQSTAQSSYNSLQLSLTQRLKRSVAASNFLHLWEIDRHASGGSDSQGETRTPSTSPVTSSTIARSWRLDFDRTHRFVASFLWDLPRRQRALSAASFFSTIGQIAGIVTSMSGSPIDIIDGVGIVLRFERREQRLGAAQLGDSARRLHPRTVIFRRDTT